MVFCDGVHYNAKDVPVEYQLEDTLSDSDEESEKAMDADNGGKLKCPPQRAGVTEER